MRHIFTTNKREIFSRNISTPINVLVLIRKMSGIVGIYLRKLGLKSSYTTPAIICSENPLTDTTIDHEIHLHEKYNNASRAKDFNELFHVKAKLSSDIGSTLIQTTTSTKTYHIGSIFDKETKEWRPCLSEPDYTFKNAYREEDPPSNPSFFKGTATTFLLVLFSVLGTFANKFATVDLSLRSEINHSAPALGNSITYTIWLKNEGATTANSIVVKNSFPISGVTLTSNSGGSDFTHNIGTGEGLWNIATLAAGDSVSLSLVGTVIERGVYFNIAEINSIGGGDTDSDSTPGNNSLAEDDITTVCFSVPLLIYPGEQYTVFVPGAYKATGTVIQWFRNGTEIIGSTPEAVVNADTSLTIKATGNYTFISSVGGCVGQGCCAIQVIAGPYGSIGDLVWKDKNDNGLKDTNEPGISNIILELYTVNGSGVLSGSPIGKDTTDNNGHYLFSNLLSGDYLVKIADSNLSDTLRISKKKDVGSDDTKDNDFTAATGFSPKITIHVDSTGNKKDNLTVDAALYTPTGSIGDFVWNDANNNGIQDGGEAGVNNVILELYVSDGSGNPVGTVLAKDTTNVSGLYKFSNLIKGTYVVKLLSTSLPAGSVIGTLANSGSDDKADSDFNSATGLSAKITLDPENTSDPLNKDNLTIDAAIYNPLGSIGDYVWRDADNDGVQDMDETGISGVILHLYAAANDGTPTGSVLKADTTDSNGFYLFSGLALGDYVVQIITNSLPVGGTISDMIDKGGNDNADSDFSATTGYSPKISVDPTTNDKKDILSIDAAIHQAIVCPTLTVSTIDGDICVGDSTYIKGISSNNASIKWYLAAINGTPVFTTNSNDSTLVFPTTTTTYYAEIDGLNPGCPNSRQPVVIVVNARPSLPSCAGVVDECIGKTINLNDYVINGATTPGGTFEWHTTAGEKSPLVLTPSTVGAGTYYLFEKSGAGCFSPPRMLKVNLKNCDTLIDLSLTKIVSTMTPKVWDNIIYTIKVTNEGPHAATNVEIEDQMPAGLEFISSAFFTKNGDMLTASISHIAAGQTITLDYLVKVASAGDKINFAQISKADQKDVDSTPGNASTTSEDDNSKVIISPIQDEPVADLSLDKTVNKTTATIGEQLTYYITVINNGSSPATNVEVTDIVPDGLTIISATGADNITTSGNTVKAKFNEIKVGFAPTFQIVVRVTASNGTIKNSAQVTKSDQKDGDSTPDNGTGNGEDDTDDVDITIIPGVCNPPVPLIATSNLYICTGESILLTSVGCIGTVVWSTGDTGNSITLSPTSSTTYTAKCKINDNCSSGDSNPISITVNQIVPPLITSNVPNNTICSGGSAILSASSCTGSVIWSNGTTASSITVSPANTAVYTAICKTNTCTSNTSSPFTITVGNAGSAPTITASKNAICNGETVVLTASACNGNITWSNGMSGTLISIMPTSTGTYSATCTASGCGSQTSSVLTITVSPAAETPGISADKEVVCAGGNVNLSASGCSGTLVWSNGVSSSSIAVSPINTTIYEVTCISGGCSSKASKTITVKPQPGAPVIASAKNQICGGESVVLTAHNCDGIVTWNTGATTATITVSPAQTTSYTAICNVDGCNSVSSQPATITVSNSTPSITATKDAICIGSSSTLTASGCSGTLLWSNGQTSSSITVDPVATITYTVTCSAGSCEAVASKTITVNTETSVAPVISASNTNLCTSGSVTLTATGCTGTVVWSNTQTGSSITVNITNTIVFAAACRIGDCESEKSNNITVTVGKLNKPVISANQTTICVGDAATLSSTSCDGNVIWSNGLTGSSITVNPVTTTEYTAVCKAAQGSCTSDESDKLTITVTSQPEPPIIACTCARPRICKGDTLTLKAIGCVGTFVWSNGQTTSSIVVNPEETTIYTVKCKVGSCESEPSAAATVNVGSPAPPLVSCKKPQVCGGSSTTLEAAGCVGTVKWSDGQVGAVVNVSPATVTSYWAVCDAGKCQSEKSNVITVQVSGSGLKKPTTKDLINVCPFTHVDLTTGVTSALSSIGGSFTFRIANSPDSSLVVNPSSVGTGSYYVFEKTANGCFSEGSRINVQIISCNDTTSCATNPATANAGSDATICLSSTFFELHGQIGGSAQSSTWTSDGNGTIDNSLSLNTKYNYTSQDIARGYVNFILTTNDPDGNGSCQAASDSIRITINGVTTVPTIESNKSPNICAGDSVILSVVEAGRYLWSNGDTTQTIVVKTSGTYSVQLLSAQGCASVSSNKIVVVANSTIDAPSVMASAKNVCPATTVNLTNAITSTPKTSGGIFEFHTGTTVGSPLLTNATAVGAGTYYVFEKSTIGCYSTGTPIVVEINTCNTPPTDTSNVELGITIVGSRVELGVGDELTYTITVTNNTVHTATNVHITNVLPKGITITSATPGFTAFGTDSLVSVIGTFPGGAIKTYTYTAKTTKAGTIRNIAKITKIDQVDPILDNNISHWDIHCLTCQEICTAMSLAADTTRQANGSYNVTFRAFIEACGNVKLENVKVTENLSTMFPAPVTYTIVQKPTVGSGSKLIPNDNFNGSSDLNLTIPTGSEIEAGVTDTIRFVINIVPNGNEGPFSTNALVEATGMTIFGIPDDVSDVSNNGPYINKPSAEPTVVRLYKSPSIGLAKIVSDSTKKANGSYDVTYQLLVKNNGSLPLNNVVLTDTLSKVFNLPATFTVLGTPVKNTGSQLIINSAFNGTTDTRLTLPGSTLAIGQTDTLLFSVNLQPDTLKLFANTAVASASGTLANGTNENVEDLSNAGTNPDAPGSNPTNLNLDPGGMSSIEIPCIGIALYVKDTVKQADGSYNVIFHSIIKNCGNLTLSNVQLCDTLSNTFPSPVVASIKFVPTLSEGSKLIRNPDYNGTTNTCLLMAGSIIEPNRIDTVKWTVNVKLNGNLGPFRNSVIVSGKTPGGITISDISNDGINPNPEGSAPTVINFSSLPEALIGISKEATEPTKVVDNTYDVTFKFKVKNYGKTDFTGVQVQDNLAVTFGDSVRIDSVGVTADAGFTVDSNYTGRGNLINLLIDSLSTLPKNTTRNITVFTRVTLTEGTTSFANQALAIGKYPSNKSVDDLSTNGTDPDPDGNGNPKDNSVATPIIIEGISPGNATVLGIAKSADLDSIPNADDTYNLTYRFVIKNYGTRTITNVQLRDSLDNVFAAEDSSNFIIAAPLMLSEGSHLKLNPDFNGRTEVNILIADSSSLAPGTADTLELKLRVLTDKEKPAIFANTAYGSAKDSTTTITDISETGIDPDPDNDGNPGNNSAPTLIIIGGTIPTLPDDTATAIIPGGFSPNNDGIGDTFFIEHINKTNVKASIYIYNRWGVLVFKDEDYGKSVGWNGKANNGLVLLSDGKDVPDGTYYYVIQSPEKWGGQPVIGFITIVR
ncbi:SdrD B-like domain-containing protein [Emticicia sp. BO119]|uniref:SdrD B-like domain-containing protein n=1 Tax=Emticicia sp. BO119 TaxID=2757768 RepID=UPI0015EFE9F3|nr:SdrD B-like domain-containing protein [Emticicia sp. BO119]MBA4853080.1 DUF11 domain-containing protein [Emticicia sp. BO119]